MPKIIYTANMIKRHKYDIIIFFALIGFSVSLYLSVNHYMGYMVPCTITHGCEVVLTSKYSSILGIPVSVLDICRAPA